LIGAIPPAIGWVSGGGSLIDPRIWVISSFFFIWQVPHFWLLYLDFAIDYEKAGFPPLTRVFTMAQNEKIISTWIGSTLVLGLLIPLLGFASFSLTYLFLLTLTFWFLRSGVKFFRAYPTEISFGFVFTKLNLYAVGVLFILSSDRLLASSLTKLNLMNKMLVITG
jgi:protoheme IX farnesyltransferase